jgi:hypothetical protein
MVKWFVLVPSTLMLMGLLSGINGPTTALSREELQMALGACEGVGLLDEVRCEKASTNCGNPPCANTSYTTACIGVNAPKGSGNGNKKVDPVQCSNTYSSGPCQEVDRCVPGEASSTGLTCGDKGESDDC